jgi:branched-chain amino acid aminotransferase
VLLWVNGSRADPASATHLSALDRGFTLADGLFETMRAYHGSLFRLDQHLDRLDHGARVLGIPLPLDLRTLIGHAMRDARDAGVYDAAVRLTVSRGVSPPGLAPPPNAQPTVVLAVHALPVRNAALDQHALHVCTARARRNEHALTAGVKTLDYVESVLAFAEARAAGADDALFLDTAGHLSEATASNVFTVVGETLLTPPAGCGVLPGITRAAVLEIAAALGIPAREQAIVPDQLRDAGEAFLTSSLREIAPIASIDHRSMPNRAPGTVTRRVADAFAALVQRECAP